MLTREYSGIHSDDTANLSIATNVPSFSDILPTVLHASVFHRFLLKVPFSPKYEPTGDTQAFSILFPPPSTRGLKEEEDLLFYWSLSQERGEETQETGSEQETKGI